MLIETAATLFVVGFVAIAAYGHVLVAQALFAANKPGDASASPRGLAAASAPQAQLRRAG